MQDSTLVATSMPPPLPLLPTITTFDESKSSGPVRKIFDQSDIPIWLETEAYYLLELMIARLSVAVEGKKVEDTCQESENVKKLQVYLQQMTAWVDDIPLQTTPQRFGNKAFRDWVEKMEQSEDAFQRSLLPSSTFPVLPELSHHFRSSFGSAARLDYGTGHELSFVAYLLILRLVGVFSTQDEQALVTRIFVSYLDLARSLQKKFRLEPAGSKGVWGLDDHHHLSYLWGASQLRTHPTLQPSSILSPASLKPHGLSYLFLSSILHINDIKSGPFAEHSPLLHNIATTVPNWKKVDSGLTKMYKEEVLKKVPVVQHFWFGNILAWRKISQEGYGKGEVLKSSGDGMDEEMKGDREQIDQKRERDEGTVAPWALPTRSGATSPTILPFHRQSVSLHNKTPTPPLASPITPKPFSEPPLFPKRKSRLSVSHGSEVSGGNGVEERGTVADEGGAAAMSSPFGELKKSGL